MEAKNIPFSQPDITNDVILETIHTLKSGWITTGPKTKLFEQRIAEYIGVNKAVCVNSATAAMELTLRILGIGYGDEVITTAYTYTATASVIHHIGAKIVLVDVADESYEMDYKKLENAITEKTKAVISVDIAGKMCNYNELFKCIENKKNLFRANNDIQSIYNKVILIEDAAHAFGAEWHGYRCGQVADYTCFSFHAVKNLTTAEGGAVVWKSQKGLDEDWLYKQFMLYSLHGQTKDAFSKMQIGTWEYDILYPGFKCNMTDITAGIGLAQLSSYGKNLLRRKELIDIYDKILNPFGVKILKHCSYNYKSSMHLYMVRIPDIDENERNQILIQMAEAGVACNVHYKPLPMLTAYKNLGFDIKDYPNSYKQYANEMTLPLHTLLADEDVEYISSSLICALNDIKSNKTIKVG